MSFLVSDAISDLQQELNVVGRRLSTSDFILFLNRANQYFQANYKLPTAERTADYVIYSKARSYPVPSDFAGIIEPKRPPALWSPRFTQRTDRELSHWPYGRNIAFSFDRETMFLDITDPTAGSDLMVFNFDDDSSSTGTFSAGGDGSGLVKTEQVLTEGTGSFRVTVAASTGTTTVTGALANQVDITDYLNDELFLDVIAPDAAPTGATVTLRIGSSASDYYQVTATTRFRGDSIGPGYGQVGFDMSTKTTAGSPAPAAIDYFRISVAHGTSSDNDGYWYFDNLFVAKGSYFEVPYYSKNNVKAEDGTYKQAITVEGDTVLCPVELDAAFTYKAAEIAAALRLQDQAMASYFARELAPKEAVAKAKYPNQESKVASTWYKRANSF
jgi:hypothetical protein